FSCVCTPTELFVGSTFNQSTIFVELPHMTVSTLPQMTVLLAPQITVSEFPQITVSALPQMTVLPHMTVSTLPQITVSELPQITVVGTNLIIDPVAKLETRNARPFGWMPS